MKKPRVLIIEDDEWLVDEYARTLNAHGYVPHHATNVLEGIRAVDAVKPVVIVLDLFMPGPNGLVLLHELKSHSDLSHIPVVVVSNSASELKSDALLPYGVLVVLDKASMQPADIVVAIKKVLP